jgi:hypothetical protein
VALGALGRDREHAWDALRVLGVVQGEVADSEWIAASQLFRVAGLLPRAASRFILAIVLRAADNSRRQPPQPTAPSTSGKPKSNTVSPAHA